MNDGGKINLSNILWHKLGKQNYESDFKHIDTTKIYSTRAKIIDKNISELPLGGKVHLIQYTNLEGNTFQISNAKEYWNEVVKNDSAIIDFKYNIIKDLNDEEKLIVRFLKVSKINLN